MESTQSTTETLSKLEKLPNAYVFMPIGNNNQSVSETQKHKRLNIQVAIAHILVNP